MVLLTKSKRTLHGFLVYLLRCQSFGFYGNMKRRLRFSIKSINLQKSCRPTSRERFTGGGTKNFSLDMAGAPGGSATIIIIAGCLMVGIEPYLVSKETGAVNEKI